MKSLGFTLIELLGVIIVLGILLTIATISISSVLNSSETELTKIQIEKLKDAAKNYYISEGIESLDFEQNNFSHCVSINYLIKKGYIDESEISNFETGEDIAGSIKILYNSQKYEYIYQEKSCEICIPATEDTKTTGNIPKGSYNVGDEYICEVKNNTQYHFFVVSTEVNNVNLIMDRNIYYDKTNDIGVGVTSSNDALVKWHETASDHSLGPVTAMEYLHNATKDWENIPDIKMNYIDENIDSITGEKGTTGYGSIKTNGNETIILSGSGEQALKLKNLKTRMPTYYEANSIWEVNNLNGYWTLASSTSGESDFAWGVASYCDGVCDFEVSTRGFGINPVITISKTIIENKDRR